MAWFAGSARHESHLHPRLYRCSTHRGSANYKPFQLSSPFPAFFSLESKSPDRYCDTIRDTRSVVEIPGVRLVGRNLPSGGN